jgi:hypothetical protein
MDHSNAVSELVKRSIEFIGLSQTLLGTGQHCANQEGFMTSQKFSDCRRGAISSSEAGVEHLGVVQNNGVSAKVWLVKNRRECEDC